ncbi:MAG: hypothetical protein MMC33_001335 [Icmadophila ericetorum]|nr:hypothetical protein [Icmadophila ericetorum]
MEARKRQAKRRMNDMANAGRTMLLEAEALTGMGLRRAQWDMKWEPPRQLEYRNPDLGQSIDSAQTVEDILDGFPFSVSELQAEPDPLLIKKDLQRILADHICRKEKLQSCSSLEEIRACASALGFKLAEKEQLSKIAFQHLLSLGLSPAILVEFLKDESLNHPGKNLTNLIVHLRKQQSYSASDLEIVGVFIERQVKAGHVSVEHFRDMLMVFLPGQSRTNPTFTLSSKDWRIFRAIWIGALKSPNLKVGHKYLSKILEHVNFDTSNFFGECPAPTAPVWAPEQLEADLKPFISLCVQCVLKDLGEPARSLHQRTQGSPYAGLLYFLSNLPLKIGQRLMYEINRQLLKACRKDLSRQGWEHQRLQIWFSTFARSEHFFRTNKIQLLNYIKGRSKRSPISALAIYFSCYPLLSRNGSIRWHLIQNLKRMREKKTSLQKVFTRLLLHYSQDYPISAFKIYLNHPLLKRPTHRKIVHHILSNPGISTDVAFTAQIRHSPYICHKYRKRKPVRLSIRRASVLQNMATTYASAEHLPPRQAIRKVLRCARYFRNNADLAKPQLSVALAMAGIVRYWKAGRWPSFAQVELVLSVIRQIEGVEVAARVDRMVILWRERFNSLPEDQRWWLRENATALKGSLEEAIQQRSPKVDSSFE